MDKWSLVSFSCLRERTLVTCHRAGKKTKPPSPLLLPLFEHLFILQNTHSDHILVTFPISDGHCSWLIRTAFNRLVEDNRSYLCIEKLFYTKEAHFFTLFYTFLLRPSQSTDRDCRQAAEASTTRYLLVARYIRTNPTSASDTDTKVGLIKIQKNQKSNPNKNLAD